MGPAGTTVASKELCDGDLAGPREESEEECEEEEYVCEASGVEPVFSRAMPKGPSEEERRRHRVTHYPFRSWCPECVAGRAKSYPHKRREESSDSGYPEISFDYCFPRREKRGESISVLVGREKRSQMLIAHVVPVKGAGAQWIVDQVVRDIRKLGVHGKIILKCDQEPAILDVMNAICRARGEDSTGEMLTVIEMAPKGESQSNGRAERAVQELEEGLRTHLLDLDAKLKTEVEIGSPAVSWLVENVADIVNKQNVGEDGKTPYERIKGKKHHGEFCEFGSQVMHKVPVKPQGGLMAPRWLPGTWLGKRWNSDEHLVAMSDGKVVRSRGVRTRPLEESWSVEPISGIRGSPWDPSSTMTYEKLAEGNPWKIPETKTARPVESAESVPVPRGFKITRSMVTKAGPTPGCHKCRQ